MLSFKFKRVVKWLRFKVFIEIKINKLANHNRSISLLGVVRFNYNKKCKMGIIFKPL